MKENNMTFEELIKIEPRLGDLRNEAVKIMANSPGRYWERNKVWYHDLKPRFKHLVGFMAEKPELRTSEAYDTAYMSFCEILKV